MLIIAGILILFGVSYIMKGYSLMQLNPELAEAIAKHSSCGTTSKCFFVGFFFLIIGCFFLINDCWIIWREKQKEIEEIKRISDSVDWEKIRKKIRKVKEDAERSRYIRISAGGETVYGCMENFVKLSSDYYDRIRGYLVSTGWCLNILLDISDESQIFIKKHVEDYISVDYPDSTIVFYKHENGIYSSWLRYYIGLPDALPKAEIRARVGEHLEV